MKYKGKIMKINAGFYYVKYNKDIYTLRGSGNLRRRKIIPLVGDYVKFEIDGFISEILERKNYFIRPKVANIDQIFIVMSLLEPKFKSYLLNKYLAIIEQKNIKPIILFTKSDITDIRPAKYYINDGYTCYTISNKSKENIDKLPPLFKNKLSALIGQSGVGKSSIINSLSDLGLKTDKISKALGRGKHTTRVTQIYNIYDGEIIDTPGFSSIELNLNKLELSKSYHDFKILSMNCKFNNCIHIKEKYCAIKNAVDEGKIYYIRYNDYKRLISETTNGKISSINTFRVR